MFMAAYYFKNGFSISQNLSSLHSSLIIIKRRPISILYSNASNQKEVNLSAGSRAGWMTVQ
jgi:hypothetical protein